MRAPSPTEKAPNTQVSPVWERWGEGRGNVDVMSGQNVLLETLFEI